MRLSILIVLVLAGCAAQKTVVKQSAPPPMQMALVRTPQRDVPTVMRPDRAVDLPGAVVWLMWDFTADKLPPDLLYQFQVSTDRVTWLPWATFNSRKTTGCYAVAPDQAMSFFRIKLETAN